MRLGLCGSEIKAPLLALHNPQPPLSGAEERAIRAWNGPLIERKWIARSITWSIRPQDLVRRL